MLWFIFKVLLTNSSASAFLHNNTARAEIWPQKTPIEAIILLSIVVGLLQNGKNDAFLHKSFFFIKKRQKKKKTKMMILDSGRQTFSYLDSFPLIVHLSCAKNAKMHFLSV